MAQSPRGDSREVAIGAKSDLTNTFVVLEANPSTKALKVDLADSVALKTAATDFEGAPVTVGTSATEITFAGTTQSIKLRSSVNNTGTIYLGKSNVTNAGANAMDEILPSEDVTLDLNDASNAIYLVSDTAAQTIYKIALL